MKSIMGNCKEDYKIQLRQFRLYFKKKNTESNNPFVWTKDSKNNFILKVKHWLFFVLQYFQTSASSETYSHFSRNK